MKKFCTFQLALCSLMFCIYILPAWIIEGVNTILACSIPDLDCLVITCRYNHSSIRRKPSKLFLHKIILQKPLSMVHILTKRCTVKTKIAQQQMQVKREITVNVYHYFTVCTLFKALYIHTLYWSSFKQSFSATILANKIKAHMTEDYILNTAQMKDTATIYKFDLNNTIKKSPKKFNTNSQFI